MKIIQDVNGKVSHKRLIAVAAFGASAVLAVIAVVLDSQIAANLVWPFITLAGGEGVASAFERGGI